MNRLLARARCDCHIWIVSTIDRINRCGRCGQKPQIIPTLVNDDPTAVTVCLHEGDDCR